MTTPALAALEAPAAGPPVPWRSLVWVTWRRHRTTLWAMLGVLGVAAVYLVVTGLRTRAAWHAVQHCAPHHSRACVFAWQGFHDTHANPGLVSALFLFAPLLIGAFAGAPVIGRELETGTFRYAWTQGVGRVRWAVAMLLTGAVVVATVSGALGALVSWHDRPLWQAQIQPRLQAGEFPSTGVAIVGWALAAYAVGTLAGLLWRRVLPAFATAVVATFGLAFEASRVRLHYLPPLDTSRLSYIAGSQTISQWWEKDGSRVGTTELNAVLRAGGVEQIQTGGGKTTVQVVPNDGTDPVSYLLHHGFTQWTSYQPAGRYWTFQWIELGWLAVLAALLLGATVLLLRHRDA